MGVGSSLLAASVSLEIKVFSLNQATLLFVAPFARIALHFGSVGLRNNRLAFVSSPFIFIKLVSCCRQDVKGLQWRLLPSQACIEVVKQGNLLLFVFHRSKSIEFSFLRSYLFNLVLGFRNLAPTLLRSLVFILACSCR